MHLQTLTFPFTKLSSYQTNKFVSQVQATEPKRNKNTQTNKQTIQQAI